MKEDKELPRLSDNALNQEALPQVQSVGTEAESVSIMNKIIVIGNLGRDPEMRYTPGGQGVTSFSVASSRRYTTSSGEQREETEWLHIR